MNDSTTASISIPPIANPSQKASRLKALNEFWQWWTGELRALVPARLMSWVVGDVAVTDLMVDASGITLVQVESGKPVALARIAPADVTTDPRLRELRANGRDQVRVLLAADQVLQKTLSLPAAIEENLREVMGFELDRYTPFVSGQAYYDVKLQRRDSQRDTIEVVLAVAARAIVDPLLATVRQAGLSVVGVTVAGAEAAGKSIELLPAGEKPARKWGNLLRLNLALLAVALLLGLLALLLPIWQKREAVIALSPLVNKSAADFEVSRRVHDEYTKLATEYNYITAKKLIVYPSLAILEEVTRISPDTTAAQSMDLKSAGKTREVTLIGEALAASKVIESLEQSPMFQNATQRSQTRKGSLGTNEWFHVATEVKPKQLPAAAILGEKPLEPVVAPPPVVVAPPENTAPAVAEPAAKAPTGNAPASGTPAKSEATAGTQVPAPVKPAVAPVDPVAAPPAVNRKQP